MIPCPGCRSEMHPFEHDGVTLDLCGGCKGLWFDGGELAKVLGREEPHSVASGGLDLETGAGPSCPRCVAPLVERRVAGEGAMRLDTCQRCTGVFLARGELQRLRRLAVAPSHLTRADQAAFRAAAPDPRDRRRATGETAERIRAFTSQPERSSWYDLSGWQTWDSAGPAPMLCFILSLPLDENKDFYPRAWAVFLVIAANLFVWAIQIGVHGLNRSIDFFAMDVDAVRSGRELHTIITCGFAHGGWIHLLSNLWMLWIFGDDVEKRWGPIGFLLLYFAALAGSTVLTLVFLEAGTRTVGASGAIAGVLAAFMVLYPGVRILTPLFNFFFVRVLILAIPAWLYFGFWFVLQSVGMFGGADGGINWAAHVGGFAVGLIAALGIRVIAPQSAPAARPTAGWGR